MLPHNRQHFNLSPKVTNTFKLGQQNEKLPKQGVTLCGTTFSVAGHCLPMCFGRLHALPVCKQSPNTSCLHARPAAPSHQPSFLFHHIAIISSSIAACSGAAHNIPYGTTHYITSLAANTLLQAPAAASVTARVTSTHHCCALNAPLLCAQHTTAVLWLLTALLLPLLALRVECHSGTPTAHATDVFSPPRAGRPAGGFSAPVAALAPRHMCAMYSPCNRHVQPATCRQVGRRL